MIHAYGLRFTLAKWLFIGEKGEPMFWFVKHFDSFEFKNKEEAENFIITFSYIYSVFSFEAFLLKNKEGLLSIDEYLEEIEEKDKSFSKIIETNLDATYIKLFMVFRSAREIFREFASITIDEIFPSHYALNFWLLKEKEYGFDKVTWEGPLSKKIRELINAPSLKKD